MGNDVWCISERQKKFMRSPLCVNYNRIHTYECTHNSYVWYTRTSRMNEMVWLRCRVYSESRHCIIVDCVCCAFHMCIYVYIRITIIILTIQRSYNDNDTDDDVVDDVVPATTNGYNNSGFCFIGMGYIGTNIQ